MYDVVIVGAGPAGLLAAARASEKGASVLVVEKNAEPGRKLLLTGNGRCNMLHLGSPEEVSRMFGNKGRFLLPALKNLSPAQTVRFFNDIGLSTKVERDRVFPASDKASDVLLVLISVLKKRGVEFRHGHRIDSISLEGKRVASILSGGKVVDASSYVLCTGGASFPHTGSTGDGYSMAKRVGHTVVKPRPALTPVVSSDDWVPRLEGLSLRDVSIGLFSHGGKKLWETRGDLLFTNNGLSGPAILDIGGRVAVALDEGRTSLNVDVLPDVSWEELDAVLQTELQNSGARMAKNVFPMLPERLMEAVIEIAGVDGKRKASMFSRVERRQITGVLKKLVVNISATGSLKAAMATTGGICLDMVERNTMRSKLAENLFFAGEVLDLDGPTGGYNLQMCWSTGWLAGDNTFPR